MSVLKSKDIAKKEATKQDLEIAAVKKGLHGSNDGINQRNISNVHEDDLDEPLLQDNPNRYVMFPLKDLEIWGMYKKHVASF